MAPLRLRTYLILLLVVTGLVTFSIVGSGILIFRLPLVVAESQNDAQEAALRVSGLLSNTLEGLENELVTIGRVAKALDQKAMHQVLSMVEHGRGRFGAMYLLSRKGAVLAADLPLGESGLEALVGTDLSGNPLFQLALVSPEPVWSSRYLSVVTGKVTIGMGLVIGEQVLLVELPSDSLRDLASEWLNLVNEFVLVIDETGEWIVDNRPGLSLNTTNWGASPLIKAAKEGLPIPEEMRLGSRQYYPAYHVSEKLHWSIIAGVPAGMDNPTYARTVYLVVLGFFGSTTIGFLLAPFWARSIVRPVTQLVKLSRQVADGDRAVDWPSVRVVELNGLSQDLRSMMRSIQDREDSLAESTARLNATIDNAPTVAFQWYDMNGRVVFWNRASTNCFGYQSEEALGKTLDQLVLTPEQNNDFIRSMKKVAISGAPIGPVVVTVHNKNGDERQVLSSIFSIPGEQGQPYFVSANIDISDRIHAQKALETNRRQLQMLLDAAPTPMLIARDMRAVEVNHAWEQLFGYKQEEVVGKTGQEMGWWESLEDRARFVDTVEREGMINQFMAWFHNRAGEKILCSVSLRSIDSGGQTLSIIIYDDMTENYKMQSELSALNQELEERVEQRTMDLQKTNEELADALDIVHQTQDNLVQAEKHAALGRLVAGIAHELNTPIGNGLMAISTLEDHINEFKKELLKGLKRSTFERFIEDVDMAADITLRNLRRSSELVSTFKQVAADRESSVRRTFDLNEVIDEVLIVLQPTLKRTPYEIRVDVEPGILMESYPGPLGQVLTNLITNSVIHGFDGRPDGRIEITASLDREYVNLQVRDNGKGMDETAAAKAFDPFYTTRQGQGGTGLGLHVLHNLVAQVLGGKVELFTRPGQGVLVTLQMPLVAPDPSVEG